jgi:hypothetical protein
MLEPSFTRSAGVPDLADDGAGERGKESPQAGPCPVLVDEIGESAAELIEITGSSDRRQRQSWSSDIGAATGFSSVLALATNRHGRISAEGLTRVGGVAAEGTHVRLRSTPGRLPLCRTRSID